MVYHLGEPDGPAKAWALVKLAEVWEPDEPTEAWEPDEYAEAGRGVGAGHAKEGKKLNEQAEAPPVPSATTPGPDVTNPNQNLSSASISGISIL